MGHATYTNPTRTAARMKLAVALPMALAAATAVALTTAARPAGSASSQTRPAAGGALELSSLKFYIEFNETNQDVGVQTSLGGEPYKLLTAFDPDGRKMLRVRPSGILRQQGLSDFFHETAEPPLSEFSLAEFFDRFPEGEYEFETVTLDGLEQDGEDLFTHKIPAGPVITWPLEGDVVDRSFLVVSWQPVTLTTALNPPQQPVNIIGYEVIVTREDPLRDLDMDVGPDTTSVSIPMEFLDPGTEYELEVLAIEESDNQTISIVHFETM